MAEDSGGGGAAEGQDHACTNAHAQPPELVVYHSAGTEQASVLQVVRLRQLGEGTLTTSDLRPDFVWPLQIIAVKDKHLSDSYIGDLVGARAWAKRRSLRYGPPCGSTSTRSSKAGASSSTAAPTKC